VFKSFSVCVSLSQCGCLFLRVCVGLSQCVSHTVCASHSVCVSLCVFVGYISGTSADGSWGILWLRTFVKARAAAGAASG